MSKDRLKKNNTIHNSRVWLNKDDHHFTGSLVCHLSEKIYDEDGEDQKYINAFVELGGCHEKARIHHDWDDEEDLTNYIEKIRTIKDEIEKYYEVLMKYK